MAGPPDGQTLAGALPGRAINVVADAAYAEKNSAASPGITWTTRLRKDAALHGLPPERTGRRGRPRVRGNRLPSLDGLAATAEFAPHAVTRYGTTVTVQAAALTCLWYSVFGTRHVQVILVRDRRATGYDLALVTPTWPGPAAVIARYASRWSIEVGHHWHRSSCAAFSWLCSLFLVRFVFLLWRCPAGAVVVAGRACPALA